MEFLKEILGEELYKQFETAVNAYNSKSENKDKQIKIANLGTGEYVGKGKYDSLEAEKTNLTGQITELNKTIETLKNGNKDNQKLQNTITELQGKLDTANADLEKIQSEALNTTKTYALKEQLSKAGVTDPDYLIFKHGGLDKFNFDKDNKPIGVEDSIKPYREDKTMAHLFGTSNQHYDPAGGNGGGNVKNPFAKDSFNLTEQGKLLKENPAQAKEMAAAAGVTLKLNI
ncbi:phage scaffolding protein [[Clostridium] polysaccharolyticum]|uniref:Phage minor structural protein GP20 n=1 Tax=[Clostridium] polysaccharolyticum TaxID=29364 RepID=A0A1H9YIE5_9FIRM|nr:phage scaffolding protein [[Clostridium] polysaccharolyticum]SES68803.1 Phage minor structural protein GP20 [[Clostridium] polysaccharolyticum]